MNLKSKNYQKKAQKTLLIPEEKKKNVHQSKTIYQIKKRKILLII